MAAAIVFLFIVALGLVLAHELGPNGAWARAHTASDRLRQERAAASDLYPTTRRTVLGTPRDWSDAA